MTTRGLATRYVPLNPATPAGTTAAAPQTTNIDVGHVILVEVQLRIPNGHNGLTGIRVDYAGLPILPWANPATWLIGDNDKDIFDVGFEVDRGLKVVTYNTDSVPHTHYLLFKVVDLPAPEPKATIFVPITARPNGH